MHGPNPEPTVTCTICGTTLIVRRDGRGFPPDIAKRKLANLCKASGHKANITYMAGVLIGPPESHHA